MTQNEITLLLGLAVLIEFIIIAALLKLKQLRGIDPLPGRSPDPVESMNLALRHSQEITALHQEIIVYKRQIVVYKEMHVIFEKLAMCHREVTRLTDLITKNRQAGNTDTSDLHDQRHQWITKGKQFSDQLFKLLENERLKK
jgi:hypothetical protein